MEACGINLNADEGCGIPEISQFQLYYRTRNIKIKFFDHETFGRGTAPICVGMLDIVGEYTDTINIMYYLENRH